MVKCKIDFGDRESLMLKSSYNTVIVGKSYISLIFAIIKAKSNDVLVIDEPDVTLGNKWYLNIGTLEKLLLQRIGYQYSIESLKHLEKYIDSVNTFICLNEKFIELGASPLSNIRELSRKLPELFTNEFINTLKNIDEKSFNDEFFSYFEKIATHALSIKKIEESLFEVSHQNMLNSIFENFQKIINDSQQQMTKQLHFVLQVLYQTVFSNAKNDLETSYLLCALLSPRFKVNEQKLCDDLFCELRRFGGDFKRTKIQDWEIYKKSLKYILLSSYEGIIRLDDLYLFGSIANKFPFKRKSKQTMFNAIDLKVPVFHGLLNNYKNKRIIFSRSERLGTNSSHWEAFIDDKGVLHGTYSYADFEGTRPSFHYKKASNDIFKSLENLLPGLDQDDWFRQVEFQSSRDIWIEYLSSKKNVGNFAKKSDELLTHNESGDLIKKLHYWGPVKAKSMGIFSYLIDLKTSEFN